ncbi:hypothetical protein FV218_06455 [Methylobacterium sp. WL69]|uniref:winged helix DNA-binding protein n=1 Tax=Methylobacterium sp. WL69 TaxID=2603893 RepID=UPI0011CCAF59|nr:winged helix DNA-binding protein [Methylobacterium sp. WL69]TXM76584.1 hypothetical protein FV218_06455 [Methylobacterium sp. WL69]
MARPPYVAEFVEAKQVFERAREITAELSGVQTEAMLVVTMHSGLLSGGEISDKIAKDKSETSKVLTYLEVHLGWIATTTDESDRRRKLYWLTPSGKIASKAIFQRVTGRDPLGALDRVPVAEPISRKPIA